MSHIELANILSEKLQEALEKRVTPGDIVPLVPEKKIITTRTKAQNGGTYMYIHPALY